MTDKEGQRPIAIGHSSDSGDLIKGLLKNLILGNEKI